VCSQPGIMAGAGYGSAGLMTWLSKRNVARQVLVAKGHRRYPNSERPSSQDRRMIFLAVAVAAGVWGLRYSTALRKLAEAGLGLNYMAREVHRSDRTIEEMKLRSLVWAESVENYFYRLPNRKWRAMRELPCPVPAHFQGGFIIHGFGPNGPQSTFSRTLPRELADPPSALQKERAVVETMTSSPPPRKTCAPNSVRCRCGAEISAKTRKLALQALVEHKRLFHGSTRNSSSAN
jgi:hypothetical protein